MSREAVWTGTICAVAGFSFGGILMSLTATPVPDPGYVPQCMEGAPNEWILLHYGETPEPAIQKMRDHGWTKISSRYAEYQSGAWDIRGRCEVAG